ncbi:MAG: TetR family transcriptional regulator [Streptosporangiales bacterium]|nr:TetR family transcriptional regulator [Streptosporangiales bacterium]
MGERGAAAGGTRRRGRPPRSEGRATRERLLDAALELFARKGYDATTVRQIAAEVGVRDSAIYGHFAGKQAIYDALLAEMGPVSLEGLDLDTDTVAAAGPRRAVPEVVGRLFDVWSTRRALLFANVVLREGAGEAGFRGLAELIEAARGRLEEPFRRWAEQGLLRGDVPPGQLVWELFAPLHVARFLYLRAGANDADLAAARRMVDDHVAFFLTCVTTPEGSRS